MIAAGPARREFGTGTKGGVQTDADGGVLIQALAVINVRHGGQLFTVTGTGAVDLAGRQAVLRFNPLADKAGVVINFSVHKRQTAAELAALEAHQACRVM